MNSHTPRNNHNNHNHHHSPLVDSRGVHMPQSLLSDAISKRQWHHVETLLQSSSSSSSLTATDYRGRNALHYACSITNAPPLPSHIMTLLLRSAGGDDDGDVVAACLARDREGCTPLHSFVRRGASSFDDDDDGDDDGDTNDIESTTTTTSSSSTLLSMLIDACPLAAHLSDNGGYLPLHEAILRSRSLNVMKRLIRAHPRAVATRNVDGDTGLDIFYRNWNASLRRAMERYDDEEEDRVIKDGTMEDLSSVALTGCGFGAGTIPYVRGEVRTIKWIYDAVMLLHDAATTTTTRLLSSSSSSSPHRHPLHVGLLLSNCPWSIARLLSHRHPPTTDDESTTLHVAATAASSSDGMLYTCWNCGLRLGLSDRWFQHRDRVQFKFCEGCFERSGGGDDDDDRRRQRRRCCWIGRYDDYSVVTPVEKTSKIIKTCLATNPRIANVPNGDGRLPFHLAIAAGKSFGDDDDDDDGIRSLLRASPMALTTRDVVSHMYPFMMAAAAAAAVRVVTADDDGDDDDGGGKEETKLIETFCVTSFGTCFSLLMESPHLVLLNHRQG